MPTHHERVDDDGARTSQFSGMVAMCSGIRDVAMSMIYLFLTQTDIERETFVSLKVALFIKLDK